MARKGLSTTPEEEREASAGESTVRKRGSDEAAVDGRMLDLGDEDESPFLRGQKRVPVRRGMLPRKAASRIEVALVLIALVGSVGVIWFTLYQYATKSWRFRIDSRDDIAISGAKNVSTPQVLEALASDIDRNIFFVPLDARKKMIEQIPWVQSATVMRLLPNRLKVVVKERTPVAFVQINSHIELIDANGVIMELPANQQTNYSFPVIIGMTEGEPVSTQAARMKIYAQLVRELDSNGAHYSRDLSDVDLSDPDDVKATVTDPHGAVLVHLGSSNFLDRFKVYVAHVQEWRTQFQSLQSVDLRYDHQVILNPDVPAAASNERSPDTASNSEATPKTPASPRKRKRP